MKVKNLRTQKYNHPGIADLEERVKDCKTQLLSILEEWHYLKDEVEPRLLFTYDSLFGDLESELHDKSKNLDEVERRVELLSVRIKRGEKLSEQSLKFVNTIVSSEINRKYKSNSTATKKKQINDFPVNIKYEIPRIYRDLVKKLHPDKNGESKEFQRFWNNIQSTYKNNDYERLRIFHQLLCYDKSEDTEIRKEEDSLRTEIRQLEFNIKSERKKIENLRTQEPFTFEELLNDKLWIAQRKRTLQEKISFLDKKIDHKQKILHSMTHRVVEKSNNTKLAANFS